MPWVAKDALSHTKKANTPVKAKHWAAMATAILKKGYSDASAIKIANSALAKQKLKKKLVG